jgi:hypothetical protein
VKVLNPAYREKISMNIAGIRRGDPANESPVREARQVNTPANYLFNVQLKKGSLTTTAFKSLSLTLI